MDILEPIRRCFTIIILSLKLFRYLGLDYRWISKLLALILYTLLLLPGFIQVAFYYLFTNRRPQSMNYGDQPRNRLDLYLPSNNGGGPKPVLIFVTGGAWIIGNKAWGSLLAMQLAERDIIVVCLDYRNFPQGTIRDMIRDVSQGITFVCNNINIYGGDRNRIYLMGQSAGAHISACALVLQAIREANGEDISWHASTNIRAFFGLSGGYNVQDLVDHFHARGLYSSIFLRIMEGVESLKKFSPEVLVRNLAIEDFGTLLPRVFLYHGTSDSSIPHDASKLFGEAVLLSGGRAIVHMFPGKTHTDLFLQDPLRGGSYELFERLLEIIHEGDVEALARDAIAPPLKRLVPDFLLKLASRISPF